VGETEIDEAVKIVEGSLIIGINAHGWDCNRGEDTTQEAVRNAIYHPGVVVGKRCSGQEFSRIKVV